MISREEVLTLAELARVSLTEEEIERLQKDISSILDYVGQLRHFEVGAPTDSSRVSQPVRNVMREDRTYSESGLMVLGSREALLNALPKREPARPNESGHSGGGDYNVVRKIIQKDE